ncbi:hypothetical protein FA95DRAFT_1529824 [Auriscalpium vulgare]|uniref:Uncharacterized protein n=1 Tax=Auriscalpium vulgare TaxID=40419 RepID=A0ACB8SC24_9AGAM|nr:hypothetical protein FA95DRAFT_1529824 [Auriscalpium vulgare]
MSSQRVLVTYSAPPAFLSSDQWKQIHDALQSQFPLRDIHWKPVSHSSIRTIQELKVNLAALDSVRDEHTSQIPSTLLDRPLLNIYLTTCEDTEAYRTVAKKQIKEWHSVVSQRKNQEWIIVHVVRSDARNSAAGIFKVKASVLDKVRADFNVEKRDRCVQLAWPMGQNNPAAWAELITRIKDGLQSAFDLSISQREEEVKRSESQRLMPGWNFCTFFILKVRGRESLATSFEGMNLIEDALRQYDELEASFTHVLGEKNLSWFGALIVPSPKDDSLPLLSTTKKPYREFILANTVSVFDLRIYMLARQCILLNKLGKLASVCKKTSAFLASFGRKLREVEIILPRHFIEAWTYSSALSAIEQTETWARETSPEGPSSSTYHASRAELLELARSQLDILGIQVDHLPNRPPFNLALSASPPPESEKRSSSQNISHLELLACLQNKTAFYDLYISLTNRAIEGYAKSGRRKFALKLHGSLAALDVHRDRLPAALQTFSSLPAHYAPHKWTSLESYMLSQAIDIYSLSGTAQDQQWINIVLSFLRSYVEDLGRELLMQEDDKAAYLSKLIASLKDVVDNLETVLTFSEHPAITFRISNTTARLSENEDGNYIEVTVRNRLPCTIPLDDILITLSGRDSERLVFRTSVAGLPTGTTSFTVFCPTSSWGTYVHESSEARVSKLHLQWNHRQVAGSSKSSKIKTRTATVVRLLRDVRALDVRLRRPRSIELGPSPRLLMTVNAGRNHAKKVVVNLTPPSGVTFRFSKAKLENDDSSVAFEPSEDNVTLLDLPPDTTISVLVPHTDASAFHIMQVDVDVVYTTVKDDEVERTLSLSGRLPTALPVAVNVQDFFRGSRLFSKFTISTTSYQHVRVSSARLKVIDGGKPLRISGADPSRHQIMTITPARPVDFLFQLDSENGGVPDPLLLSIRYRMLRDEVEALIEQCVNSALVEFPEQDASRSRLVARTIQALEGDATWVQLYGVTGELKVPPVEEPGDFGRVVSRVIEILGEKRSPDDRDSSWHEIRIPVDIPLMNILAAACLRILSSPFSTSSQPVNDLTPLYAGQPISALLSIRTSFHWGVRDSSRKSYRMRFDIEEMVRDWLVSGRKRGDFEATDGGIYTVPVTLIALHHGELSLPKVAVTPLPLAGEMTMGSLSLPNTETYQVHGAEKVLVLPRGGRTTFVVGMGEGIQ